MLGPEARGFILGAAIAVAAGVGFVPARRPGKLPPETVSARYLLEYGENSLELHPALIRPGCRVVLHDDVLATGGTVAAINGLVEHPSAARSSARASSSTSTFLGGRDRLAGTDVFSLIDVLTENPQPSGPGQPITSRHVRRADQFVHLLVPAPR